MECTCGSNSDRKDMHGFYCAKFGKGKERPIEAVQEIYTLEVCETYPPWHQYCNIGWHRLQESDKLEYAIKWGEEYLRDIFKPSWNLDDVTKRVSGPVHAQYRIIKKIVTQEIVSSNQCITSVKNVIRRTRNESTKLV